MSNLKQTIYYVKQINAFQKKIAYWMSEIGAY